MSARAFLGAGDLFIQRYNPQTQQWGALEGPFETKKFELAPKSELKEQTSKGKTTYGQVIESVTIPQPTEFSVELGEVNKDSLALALMGTSTSINQPAGTIAKAAALTVPLVNGWAEMTQKNWGTVTAETTAGVALVIGTDVEVNYRLGLIRPVPGGAVAAGTSIKVYGSFNALSGTSIAGATQAQLRARFVMDGVNFADNKSVVVTVHEAVLSAQNAMDFLADDFATVALSGRVITPAGKSEPFVVELAQ